jgi:energy-coupling factor transport system ATP-binding protein
MIEIQALNYSYPATTASALQGIDLQVPAGQFCALLGANGAGKSTLCYAIAGFVPHFYHGQLTGTVRVAGVDVPGASLPELAGTIGMVFANPFNQITGARFTVYEEVAFGLENLGVPRDAMPGRVDQALALAGLTGLAERSPYALSGGQQQRVAIASVLVMRPRVLVLDEPTSQLDPAGTQEVFAALSGLARAGGTTIILAEHKLEPVATYADRVLILADGRLTADGAPREVLARPDLVELGLAPTRYTQAAALAVTRTLVSPDKPRPVTLPDAIAYFAAEP